MCAGYFDVRDFDETWVRIACRKGDMIVLPEGARLRGRPADVLL